MKDKKTCCVCHQLFEPTDSRTETCGRPCHILRQYRASYKTALRNLDEAKRRLDVVEKQYSEGKLPMGRQPVRVGITRLRS